MIIYKDIISGDELMSDTFKLTESAGGLLWETDCKRYQKKNQEFELEGANPSAEGGDDGGDETGNVEMVLDIQESFQLQPLDEHKPSKAQFKDHLKRYVKKVNNALKEKNASADVIKAFQAGAAEAVKKIIGNYDNYDVFMGNSLDPDAMHVLVDYREDGVTPFATIWKHGLEEMKV